MISVEWKNYVENFEKKRREEKWRERKGEKKGKKKKKNEERVREATLRRRDTDKGEASLSPYRANYTLCPYCLN